MIVKKAYPKLAKRDRQRIWKLKHLEKEAEDGENNVHAMKKKSAKEAKNLADREMRDYNDFLQDIEEDPEMRANINLYKDDDVIASLERQLGGLNLTEGNPANTGKSPADAALDRGEATVGG